MSRGPSHRCTPASQRGVAFIVVIWLMALLVILLGAFALIARTEGMHARHLYDAAVARYAAEAGINEAAYFLSVPDPQMRWTPDGRGYAVSFDDAEVEVKITDESGLVDLNVADQGMLVELFLGAGVEADQAAALAAVIQDWWDLDDLISPNGAEDDDYAAGGYTWGAKDAPFAMVSELLQVFGMTPEIYNKIETAVTVYGGQSRPNLAFAPLEVILSIPGMTPELAQQIIDARHAWDPTSGAPPPLLPDGTPLMAQGGTGTYSIESRATLPNGTWTQVDATIRLGGGGVSGMAYTVLRWQDGKTR